MTAPGVNVASDYPGGFDPSNNGTSFASAFVSGEAALVRAAYPRLTAAQVVHRIIATAAGRTGAHTGAGMINPVQAVTAVLPAQPAASPLPRQVRVPRPRALNSLTRTVALSVTGGALVTAALVAIAAIVVPQGRRRHWHPGPLAPAPSPAAAPAPATPAPLPLPPRRAEGRQRLILSRTELRARITLCHPHPAHPHQPRNHFPLSFTPRCLRPPPPPPRNHLPLPTPSCSRPPPHRRPAPRPHSATRSRRNPGSGSCRPGFPVSGRADRRRRK